MKRAQIVCIGSSSMYGVGGTKGSWVDLFKQDLHQQQYGSDGIGEVHEVYNLAIPGATIEDFIERTEVDLLATRKPGRRLIAVIQLGGNNTKAVDAPENYVTSTEEFKVLFGQFLDIVKKYSDEVLCIGMNLMDESKVMPIEKDRELNRKVYFPNKRKIEFDAIIKDVCNKVGVQHVPMIEEQQKLDWVARYQYKDGIHPNDLGYQWMHEQIKPHVMGLLTR